MVRPTALPSLKPNPGRDSDPPPFGEATLRVLNHLRLVALGCRSAARQDLFKACALLAIEKDRARATHAEALVRALPEALGRAPRLMRPGVAEVSFDEAWLLRLVGAAATDDGASVEFLLRSRVCAPQRRNIGFLVHSLARQMRRD